MGADREVRSIVTELARYLRANPHACDTAEGICRWWLGADLAAMDTLSRALAWMIERGLMQEQVALDGRARYRRSATDAQLKRTIEQGNDQPKVRH